MFAVNFVVKDQEKLKLLKIFKIFDQDGDGMLSRNDLSEVLKQMELGDSE